MCVALPVVAAGLAIAQGVASYSNAQQQAKQQGQLYTENWRNTVVATGEAYAQEAGRLIDEGRATGSRLFEEMVARLRVEATARTSAGEAGQTGPSSEGGSVHAVLADLFSQGARRAGVIMDNYQIALTQFHANTSGGKAQSISRINGVRQAVDPSVLPYALQAAGGVVNARRPAGLGLAGLDDTGGPRTLSFPPYTRTSSVVPPLGRTPDPYEV